MTRHAIRPCMLPAVLALGLAGCASLQVRSFVGRGANLQQYHSYAWGPAGVRSTGDPRLDNNEFFDRHVRTAIDKELAGRGFEPTASGAADLLVRYHASLTQKLDLGDAGQPYASRDHVDAHVFVYDAGTLVVDLVDPVSKALVWRGWAEGSFDGVVDNQRWLESRIDEAARRILQQLPKDLK
jgi:Domain of unknown function (DUF4136)